MIPATPSVQIRFGLGVGFGNVLVLGDSGNGILGTNVLGTAQNQTVDISDLVQQISIRRGRDRVFEEYSPGTATIRFVDQTGDWNPDNPSGPYYGQILPMRQVKVAVTYNATAYSLFTGFIQSWDWEWDTVDSIAWVTIQATDAFRILNLANITTVTGAANGDLPGARVTQILNTINWPSSLRQIDNGDVELQNDSGTTRTALAAIQTVEQTELGGFYIDGDGKATFRSRSWYSTQATQTPVDFDDDGTGYDYQTLDVAFDDTELSNSVTVTRESGTAQTATDSTSISNYFLRSYSRSGLLMRTNEEALAQANAILNYRKTPRLRVESIGMELVGTTARISTGLGLDIGDPIHVHRTMPGGSRIDVLLLVQGVAHDITPDRWFTTFTTAYPLSTSFILGDSTYGVLGTSTL